MASPPQSTKTSLSQSLQAHAREHWPQLTDLHVRFRGQFAYAEGELADGEVLESPTATHPRAPRGGSGCCRAGP